MEVDAGLNKVDKISLRVGGFVLFVCVAVYKATTTSIRAVFVII